jgi:hypothetical protein
VANAPPAKPEPSLQLLEEMRSTQEARRLLKVRCLDEMTPLRPAQRQLDRAVRRRDAVNHVSSRLFKNKLVEQAINTMSEDE